MNRLSAVSILFASICVVQGATIYNSVPGPLPPNMPSLGYQATQTSEFGGLIEFSGTARDLTTVTVVMSDWAMASSYGSNDPTWTHPLTMNLYNVDESGPVPVLGSLIASRTTMAAIPWRPEADSTCSNPSSWRASNGTCYNGLAFPVDFDFLGITVPDRIVYGLAFNTNTWGYSPLNAPGPYESLNFALAQTSPSSGSNPYPGTAFWNTMTAGNYTDNGAGGVGTFRQDTNWAPYSGSVSFDATGAPEPATCGIFAVGLAGLLALKARNTRPRG